MILHRSLAENLAEILVRPSRRGPCMRSLQMPSWRCLHESFCGRLLGGSGIRILYDPLQQQVLLWRSCEILLWSWHEDLAQGLLRFLVRRSCGDPSEMLSGAFAWSCTGPWEALEEILVKSSRCPLHDLAQALVRRSCGDPVEILLKRSLH